MKTIITIILTTFLSVNAFSQKNDKTDLLLKQIKKTCDSLTEIENYTALKSTASNALLLINKDNYKNLSLYNYYIGNAIENRTERDSAIFYHLKSLDYAKQGNVSKRIRIAHQRLLFLYHSAGNEQKADLTAATLQTILDTTNDNTAKYEMLSFLGNYYSEKSNYEKTTEYLINSLDIQQQLFTTEKKGFDTSDIGITNLNIANAFIKMQQGNKALEFITQSRPYLKNYLSGLSYYHKNYIDALILNKNPTTALLYYDSLTFILKDKNAGAFEWSDKIAADLAFAEYYLAINQADSAFVFANRANIINNDKKSDYTISQINYMLGKVYVAQKKFNIAIPLLKQAETITRQSGLETHANLLLTLAQSYTAIGNHKLATDYYAKYTPLRDTLYSEASKKNIAIAEAKFQNKQKQQEIENKNLQLKVQRNKIYWAIGGLAFSALIAFLLFANNRIKKKNATLLFEKNKTLQELNLSLDNANQTKAKLFSIISHDLRSPISQVYQFLKLQQLNPNVLSESQKDELSNKIQLATGSLLETMEDLLLWSKTQLNSFTPNVEKVQLLPLINHCRDLFKLNLEAKNVTITTNLNETINVVTDNYYLQTIIRNLLQNAIKASPNNENISISATNTSDKFQLIIENQGKSFTQNEYKTLVGQNAILENNKGLGLRLVDELAKQINLDIHFTATNDGTVVTLTFKNN